jgi:hypothetical protein
MRKNKILFIRIIRIVSFVALLVGASNTGSKFITYGSNSFSFGQNLLLAIEPWTQFLLLTIIPCAIVIVIHPPVAYDANRNSSPVTTKSILISFLAAISVTGIGFYLGIIAASSGGVITQ